ncbi:hypothetical protein PPYR_14060 [Photinus pyralis]|uniref:UBC core domain-containing protein n=2 Tax=Photinus pyralis TaxID=7054 RepID=A0A1Y1L6X2_PHOPY|nr:ubiquitin-conjugating enzyme E2 J1-like [Photinus pyralis]XP_031356057.1 ubiquitin-conjugating enzyme E2 J1-like [Photinus pyralis]KAB0792099.1 hypothetical protein PPYR_14060 [Photinus pyralis]
MSLKSQYNLKSPGVKRLMREACELADPTEEYFATPLEDNLFEWHFTVRGPPNTEFEDGVYHGRILLPSEYPMQPPNIILLTPNGRFEINKKICLSISGHHPESWQPSWSIRTALLALIAFMPTSAAGTIGSLEYTKEERQALAKKSKSWECTICGRICDKLSQGATSDPLTTEESSMLNHIALKAEEDSKTNDSVRHRTAGASVGEVPEAFVNSIPQSNKDRLWEMVMWVLLGMIVLLIARRFFFL